tara:strand:+ start:611 stop:1378 length:768 start_codon:yes stop_codon:yes gene_type:complete
MKLYVALSILDREEWSGSTVCSAAAGAFELVLRNCLRNEGGEGKIAAHASLYFTGADEQMQMQNKLFYRGGEWTGPKEDFFLDILYDEPNTVSYASDPASWYARWVRGGGTIVQLYEVLDVDDEQIRAAHRATLDLMASGRAYDPTLNINSLFPCVEVPCGCFFCCCQCWAWKECKCCVLQGITCVSAVLTALAATRGASENGAEHALGINRRATLAGRLPREMVIELVQAGVVSGVPMRLEIARAVRPSSMERF